MKITKAKDRRPSATLVTVYILTFHCRQTSSFCRQKGCTQSVRCKQFRLSYHDKGNSMSNFLSLFIYKFIKQVIFPFCHLLPLLLILPIHSENGTMIKQELHFKFLSPWSLILVIYWMVYQLKLPISIDKIMKNELDCFDLWILDHIVHNSTHINGYWTIS